MAELPKPFKHQCCTSPHTRGYLKFQRHETTWLNLRAAQLQQQMWNFCFIFFECFTSKVIGACILRKLSVSAVQWKNRLLEEAPLLWDLNLHSTMLNEVLNTFTELWSLFNSIWSRMKTIHAQQLCHLLYRRSLLLQFYPQLGCRYSCSMPVAMKILNIKCFVSNCKIVKNVG